MSSLKRGEIRDRPSIGTESAGLTSRQPRAIGDIRAREALKLDPAVRQGLANTVADRLRETLLQGIFPPAERLREVYLADLLQVSRGPVREALAQLEREGLVVITRYRGASVARLSEVDLEEVYSLRAVLEPFAVQLAISRATEQDLAAMDRVVEKMSEAVDRGITLQESAALDTEFHTLIYHASHHRRLIACWSVLRAQMYLFQITRNLSGVRPGGRRFVVRHARILNALHARDLARAVEITDEHVRSSYPPLPRRALGQGKDRQSTTPMHG